MQSAVPPELYFPALHSEQLADCDCFEEYAPDAQVWHVEAPAELYVPATHPVQTDSATAKVPVAEDFLPAAHVWHVAAPAVKDHVPSEQSTQTVEPVPPVRGLAFPATQSVQEPLPDLLEYFPTAHIVQSDSLSWYDAPSLVV